MKIVAVLCAALTSLVLAAAAAAGVSKFTFTGETFTDGDGAVVTTTGVIRAGSKTTGNGNTFTTCDYFTVDGAYLGQFEAAGFASTDAADVESFCLTSFPARATG